jgi:hypothetical protein
VRREVSRRIQRLEKEAGINPTPIPNIFLHFIGKKDAVPNYAEAKGLKWERQNAETDAAFKARIISDLTSRGHKPPFLVYMEDNAPLNETQQTKNESNTTRLTT